MDAIIKECAWETTDNLYELRGRLERIYEMRDTELRDMQNRVQFDAMRKQASKALTNEQFP